MKKRLALVYLLLPPIKFGQVYQVQLMLIEQVDAYQEAIRDDNVYFRLFHMIISYLPLLLLDSCKIICDQNASKKK